LGFVIKPQDICTCRIFDWRGQPGTCSKVTDLKRWTPYRPCGFFGLVSIQHCQSCQYW